jgi:ECF sigma factor
VFLDPLLSDGPFGVIWRAEYLDSGVWTLNAGGKSSGFTTQPPARRNDFLSETCKDDLALRREVEISAGTQHLDVEEAAEALRISPETAKRDWKMAKAWLSRELSGTKACSE